MIRNLGARYSPLYFLAALGMGGMAVQFFMYFMFLTPHKDTPIPTFDTIQAAWAAGDGWMHVAIVVAYAGMIAFLLGHIALLAWNLRELAIFKRTPAYETLHTTNAEITMLAVPLTLGMTVNGAFIATATLVPGIWGLIEMLLPGALVAFTVIGAYALILLGRFVARIITQGGFDHGANTGFNQLLGAFALAMVAVGFSASAAMSKVPATVLAGLVGSIFFAVIAILWAGIFLPLGMKSMLRSGLGLANSATLWLPVPIMTLLGIMVVRDRHGLQTLAAAGPFAAGANHDASSVGLLVFLVTAIAIQLAFLLFGHVAMRRNGFYFSHVLGSEVRSPVAFTLVCPGVALGVLSFFALHTGLVANGLVERGSLAYLVLLGAIFAIQAATITLIAVLAKNQLFRRDVPGVVAEAAPAAEPAASLAADAATVRERVGA